MLYSELLAIFNELPLFESPEAIKILREQYGLDAPDPVIKEIYYALAGFERHQTLYGHLELSKIEWIRTELPSAVFLGIGDNATFPNYLHEVSEDYHGEGFVLDLRPEVDEHWRKFGTWLEPPFLIDRSLLVPKANGLHLVEGHTRVGTLLGALKYNFVTVAKRHSIFLAKKK
ncbi:hypothetical protein [Enterobacter hormaechei]|uniref:hypothetical protein n=1 Tax=Enterobacter hormaechei TaxID=158836 RepID=UPI0012B864C7|nr:hypothetical protein [Enterobacter hormaechei]MBT2052915.1 hypothetical protein [Enterobacter hormaechei subsp. hoffmannii]MCW4743970.1 hypothetical protein [Enterobacter hormaechei subsp. hoffmannii]